MNATSSYFGGNKSQSQKVNIKLILVFKYRRWISLKVYLKLIF